MNGNMDIDSNSPAAPAGGKAGMAAAAAGSISDRPAAYGIAAGSASTAEQAGGNTAGAQIPKTRLDLVPLALVLVVGLVGWPLVGSTSTWITLTVAGLAMGMIVFLMDVLNFGYGVFIALGAFVATSVLGGMADWTQAESLWRNLAAVFAAMLVAMAVAGAVGLAFERVLVRPVYGQHLKQILITMGGMIIGEELIKVVWGPAQTPLPLPELEDDAKACPSTIGMAVRMP